MLAQIKHLAIASDNYALEGKFYEALFGMRGSSERYRPEAACSLSDGYLGMNINPRRVGNQGGLDHFGFEVSDFARVCNRVREGWPGVDWVQRPIIRPFAAVTMHDPAGNIFDISEIGDDNRKDIYAEMAQEKPLRPRRIDHFVLRAIEPQRLCQFYTEVFELEEQPRAQDDPHHYLSDGRITLVIAPWQIQDFLGMNIERPALDHIGFAVDSIEQFQADLERLLGRNPALTPKALGLGAEGEARLKLARQCPLGQHHLADLDGVMLDVRVPNTAA